MRKLHIKGTPLGVPSFAIEQSLINCYMVSTIQVSFSILSRRQQVRLRYPVRLLHRHR
jgi:hypothetical protein